MDQARLTGTIQVDVDDLWVYYESIGQPTPADTQPLAFTQGIPRLLDLFDRFGVRGTFFVCGRDLPNQAAVVCEIARRGHEVANHSAAHRNGFARLSPAELRADIVEAGAKIAQTIGELPVGFKAPGFSFNPALPVVLAELGYLYDSSLLPTPYAPGIRLLQTVLSGGHVDPTHYGQPLYGLAPLSPYLPDPARPYRSLKMLRERRTTVRRHPEWEGRAAGAPRGEGGRLCWEAPVTTMPFLRLPMHSTFVLAVGRPLFDVGLILARLRRIPINYLLHAADVVDAVADPALASYRFLQRGWDAKRSLYEHMLAALSKTYRLIPTREFVNNALLLDGGGL